MCYILCTSSSVYAGRGGFGGNAPKFFFHTRDHIFGTALYLGGFLTDGFLFPVKELGFFLLIKVIGLWFWMSLALICILYCKHCNTMNEYKICWFS
jgi:hypothetical protein